MLALQDTFRNRFGRVLVLGAGVTGLSCVRYLRERSDYLGIADSRAHPPGGDELRNQHPGVAVHFGSLPVSLLQGIDTLVMSPGISTEHQIGRAHV